MNKLFCLPFLLISNSIFAQGEGDSLLIYTPEFSAEVTRVAELNSLPVHDVLHFNEMENVLIYADSLNMGIHLAWKDSSWLSTELSEYLDYPDSSLGELFFSDLNGDGRNEMIAVFESINGRSGWQSGFHEQTSIALVWDFSQRRCLGIIPVDYSYESRWVVNSEVFDEENLYLWEDDEEPELEYDGENIQTWMDIEVKGAEIILKPTPIDCSVPEDQCSEISAYTYHIYWDPLRHCFNYWVTK